MAAAESVPLLVPPALRGLVRPHKKRKKLASRKVKVRVLGPWPCRRASLLPPLCHYGSRAPCYLGGMSKVPDLAPDSWVEGGKS